MIVLSRKIAESILINFDITVTVVEIRGDKVRLGIVAPKAVPVGRKEIYDTLKSKEAYDVPQSHVSPKVDWGQQSQSSKDVIDRLAAKISVRSRQSLNRD